MLFRAALVAIGMSTAVGAAAAAPLNDPPMLPVSNHPNYLMVARPQQLPFPGQPIGYTYEICPRPADPRAIRCPVPGKHIDLRTCPTAADPPVSPYGGSRIQAEPGQTLRIRLVNCLPPDRDAKHAKDDASLTSNPSNLHLHGLIVEPRRADDPDDSFGDYVFVVGLAKGIPLPRPVEPAAGHGMHGFGGNHARNIDYRQTVVDYAINIPTNHPAGLFWFHPHVHGLASNQITGGLAGLITIGDVHSYVCDHDGPCARGELRPEVRHLMLKDTQVTADARVRFQENFTMCGAATGKPGNIGGCTGTGSSPGTTGDGNDGRWEFTINGQSFPDIPIKDTGEVWRIANGSASATYNLGIEPAVAGGSPVVFQVLAIDGVSLVLPPGATPAQARALFGGRIAYAPCGTAALSTGPAPVCATSLRMMPSARAEIFVPADAGKGEMVLRTQSFQTGTGDKGDVWPLIDLAKVVFPPKPAAAIATRAPTQSLNVTPSAARAIAADGALMGQATTSLARSPGPVPSAVIPAMNPSAAQRARMTSLTPRAGIDCSPLAQGMARQIVFGMVDYSEPNPEKFGLGYRVVNAAAPVSPNGANNMPIVQFDHAADPTVCVRLGPGDTEVTETWVLVNLTPEDHNFHIHQTRFYVKSTSGDGETVIPGAINGHPVALDNVPVPHGTGTNCDGSTKSWVEGKCTPGIVTVEIPFKMVGDFVYHCHVLEHEDGGMMAKIAVVPHWARESTGRVSPGAKP